MLRQPELSCTQDDIAARRVTTLARQYDRGVNPADLSALDPEVVVEDAQAYLRARGAVVVEDLGDVVVRHVPFSPAHWFGAATRPRFTADDAEDRIAAVRNWFSEHGRTEFTWMVGQSATPADVVARLRAAGAELDEDDPIGEGMILDH